MIVNMRSVRNIWKERIEFCDAFAIAGAILLSLHGAYVSFQIIQYFYTKTHLAKRIITAL